MCKLNDCPYAVLYAAQGYDLVCDDCIYWMDEQTDDENTDETYEAVSLLEEKCLK